MKSNYDKDFLISMLESQYPWIDKIETATKKVSFASAHNDIKPGDSMDRTIIKLYFNYDNPDYIKLIGKGASSFYSPKHVKQEFYDFLRKYIGVDVMAYGSPVELEFYEIGPKKI